jgi:hypothetical protein
MSSVEAPAAKEGAGKGKHRNSAEKTKDDKSGV